MYEVREYREIDLFTIEHRKEELDEFIGMDLDPHSLNESYMSGDAFTLLYDGKILCCGGVIPIWSGLGEVWWRASVHMHEHGGKVIEVTKERLDTYKMKFRRVQTNVISDWEEAVRFIGIMGFHLESVMPKYGPYGESQSRYVILVEEG